MKAFVTGGTGFLGQRVVEKLLDRGYQVTALVRSGDDAQRLKASYYQLRGTQFAGKMIVLGALSLYLDFINLFMMLLQLLGARRD